METLASTSSSLRLGLDVRLQAKVQWYVRRFFFGSKVQYEPDDKFALGYSVVTVSGLRSVQLIERGTIIEIWEIDEEAMTLDIGFSMLPKDDT